MKKKRTRSPKKTVLCPSSTDRWVMCPGTADFFVRRGDEIVCVEVKQGMELHKTFRFTPTKES